MRINEALELERRDFEKRMQLRQKKAHDYATDYDVLSNFKLMANLIKTLNLDMTKPHGVAMFFVLHKIARITNLWNKGVKPENESLIDSFLDLSNYVDLAKECYIDYMRKENGVCEASERD